MKKSSKKKNGIVGKTIKIIFIVIALVILLIAGTIMYKANTNPDKVPDIFGYKPMIVLSGSMEKTINTGDLVFAKIVDTDKLKKDDIISFRNEEDKITTHRIIEVVSEKGERSFRTKGDNNNTADANLVPASDVEGKYVFKLNGVGNFLIFMQKPLGLALVLLIILVIGLIWLYLVNKKDEKKYKEEDEKERLEFEEFKKQRELERQKEEKKDKEEDKETK